ncbi:MAG: TolB family protein, partial [Myxococcota bacterium]
EVFRAYRVWSMGVSRGNDRIAFACGDPDQAQNYGIQLGDAIQHTWIYDVATQSAQVVAYGNINDECHAFGPGDEQLYVCRRYDFDDTPSYKGWRIGAIDLTTLEFEFLTPEQDQVFALHPQPTPDESEMLYGLIDVPAAPPSGVRSIMKKALPSGVPEAVRDKADMPVLSPDGSRYLFRNYDDGRTLWSSSLDGQDSFQVVAAEATEPVWSPDGSRVAYLLRDAPNNCDHIYTVAADGSESDSPFHVRDCAATGEFITELDWIVVP